MGGIVYVKKAEKQLANHRDGSTFMGAKVANQINTNQQSNMSLTQLSVVNQNSSTINLNLV